MQEVAVISTKNQVEVKMKGMAVRKNQQSSKQIEVENREILKKTRQSSATKPTQRRAFNEIGNLVQQQNVRGNFSVNVEISMEDSKTTSKPQLRMSTRLSVAQSNANHPRKATRANAKHKETSVTDERSMAQPWSKVRVMGPPTGVPVISDRSQSSVEPAKRKSTAIGTRAPRLTMKPPPGETPPEERLAAQNLIRQSLAAEHDRRFTMALNSEIQLVRSTSREAVRKSHAEKKEIPEIRSKEDIDRAHRRCFWMVSNYSKQVYAYLHRLDRRMTPKIAQEQLKLVKETTRTKLVEWMALAYLRLGLLQETFQLSVSILDRYLLLAKEIKETRFELVAVTCTSLAIKYEELLTTLVRELLSLSSRPYTMKEYMAMEVHVIKELGFQVARPIPLEFLRRYNTAAKCDRTQHSIGKYFTDLAQLDSNLTRRPASSLAAAAAFIGITLRAHRLEHEAWSTVMVHYSTLNFDEIKPVVSRMAMLALPGGPQCKPLKVKYDSEVSYLSTERAQHLLIALRDLCVLQGAQLPVNQLDR